MTTAIIVASGSSSRMGFDKLAANLNGVSVLQRTINIFSEASSIDQITLVCSNESFLRLDTESFTKPLVHVLGGATRQESVWNGLSSLSDEVSYVSIHDGARPLISVEQINKTLAKAKTHKAVASARRVTETVKRVTEDGFISESVSREHLWIIETPQVFERGLIVSAYKKIKVAGVNVTDETSAVEFLGEKVFLVCNSKPNPKITYPEDLKLASMFIDHD